jgi:hypothetical protein
MAGWYGKLAVRLLATTRMPAAVQGTAAPPA